MPRGSRHRNWVLTLNNPAGEGASIEEHHAATLLLLSNEDKVAYSIFQIERGESGTLHAQGYIQFHHPQSLSGVRSTISPRGHYEVRRGTHSQAKKYASKEDSRVHPPEEFGEENDAQGARSDLLAIKEKLDVGTPMVEVAQEHFGSWVRYHKSFAKYISLIAPPRTWVTEALVFWGPSGTGKSKRACEMAGDSSYWLPKPNSGRAFWDGYVGQEVVVIDEFYGWLPFDFMLRLLDRYPLRVENKGSSVQFTSKRIIFTSNQCPVKWYRKGLGSLRRRLTGSNGAVLKIEALGEDPLPYELPEDPVAPAQPPRYRDLNIDPFRL
jgi:hypothetical protein